jgi:hypothetical protein
MVFQFALDFLGNEVFLAFPTRNIYYEQTILHASLYNENLKIFEFVLDFYKQRFSPETVISSFFHGDYFFERASMEKCERLVQLMIDTFETQKGKNNSIIYDYVHKYKDFIDSKCGKHFATSLLEYL